MDVYEESELEANFNFRTAEVVGRGGLGHVSLLTNNSTGEKFALKTQPKGVSNRRNTNIKREKCALQAIDHPNIIKLIAVFEGKQYVYFLLELMSPRDLWDWCKMYAGLPINSVKYYAAEIVMALEYLRTKGIVHRDMKARNVLMSFDQHVKLADFGTARMITDRFGRPALTGEDLLNTQCGTVKFAPPEVMQKAPVTYSTDLWGLAVITSELYCGEWCCARKEGEVWRDYWTRLEEGEFEIPGFPAPDKNLQNLIQRLTRSAPAMRIGATRMVELKFHSFFYEINFPQLRHTPPPPLPKEIPKPKPSRKLQPHVHPGFSIQEGTKTYEEGTMFRSPPPKHPKDARDCTMGFTKPPVGTFQKLLTSGSSHSLSASSSSSSVESVTTGVSSLTLQGASSDSESHTATGRTEDSQLSTTYIPPAATVAKTGQTQPSYGAVSVAQGGARPKVPTSYAATGGHEVKGQAQSYNVSSSGRSPMQTLPSYTNIGQTQPHHTAPVQVQQAYQSTGQSYQSTGQPYQSTGQPYQSTGQPYQSTGQPYQSTGQQYMSPGVQVSGGMGQTQQPYMSHGAPGVMGPAQPAYPGSSQAPVASQKAYMAPRSAGQPPRRGVPQPFSLSSLQTGLQAANPKVRQKSIFPFPQGKPQLQVKPKSKEVNPLALDSQLRRIFKFDEEEWSKARTPGQSPRHSPASSPPPPSSP